MLDASLFPPEVHYELNDNFGTEKSCYLRQVRIKIIDDEFAVLNARLKDGKWVASFVILRAIIPPSELECLADIVDVVQAITPDIEKDEVTEEQMLKVLRHFTE